jgi:hypothetical protein
VYKKAAGFQQDTEAGSGQLATGNWQLETGNWKLVGNW